MDVESTISFLLENGARLDARLETLRQTVAGLGKVQKEQGKEIRSLMKIAKVGLEMMNKHEARLAKSEANIERIFALLLSRQNGRGNGGRKK
ncbi:MAG: hypothetical protein ACRD44_00680 [Bryobacteraceae bacterium]